MFIARAMSKNAICARETAAKGRLDMDKAPSEIAKAVIIPDVLLDLPKNVKMCCGQGGGGSCNRKMKKKLLTLNTKVRRKYNPTATPPCNTISRVLAMDKYIEAITVDITGNATT